jgi:hypothetical protein
MEGGASEAGADAVFVTAPGVAAVDGDPMAGGPRETSAAIGVTYRFDAETWLDRWGAGREFAVAVSAGERSRSAGAAATAGAAPGSTTGPNVDQVQTEAGIVETVPSVGDVGAVGATVHGYLDEWRDHHPTVYVDSLSDVVNATSSEVAFRFLHALVARARDADARVVVSVGDDLPEHVVGTFAPLFDRVT